MEHVPVMTREVLAAFQQLRPDAVVVDATFGRGGHARALLGLLGPGGRLIAMDWDEQAVQAGQSLAASDVRVEIHRADHASIEEVLREACGSADGVADAVLVDLGVSSPQLDEAARGLSFLHDGPLDMRMDQRRPLTAARFVNEASEEALANCFYEHGDERYSRRIAAAIVRARAEGPFMGTRRLAEVVAAAHPRWPANQHPATRVFQALRIHVNDEAAQLDALLAALPRVLRMGGRAVVIAFHSGEDRRVKRAFNGGPRDRDPRIARLEAARPARVATMRAMGRAQRPADDEVAANPRARSAVLRIAERVA